MERKEATHSEDPIYGASSSSTSLHVDRGKGIKYEGGDRQEEGDGYDVFLSFKGKDTGRVFTDHLYNSLVDAGIRVFRDDNEFSSSEKIGPELLSNIMQAKISIPIISGSYASSEWCLHELVQMLKCKRSKGQIVLPIFYKVEPSQLPHLIGIFGDAINAHKRNLDEMVVKEWEEALEEVSTLKGWESEKIDYGNEGALVKMVVTKVMSELKRLFLLNIPQQFVGIDYHVEKIMSLIDGKFDHTLGDLFVNTLDYTHIVGIYGMDGIGKTTLAKVLYDKLSCRFKYLSFVANIRETSEHMGIECLQKQLITDIIGKRCDLSNVAEGIAIIKSHFTWKKVLILLDNVDDNNQLNALCGDSSWFKAGSLVIITTRNKSILDGAGVVYTHQLSELSQDQSLILFSRHAFRKDHPHTDYERISHDIVATTGGLPLALEVVGSFLYGKTKAIWENALENLREVPTKNVQEMLRISYEVLDYESKQIFLDIACFFIGFSKQSPTYMWDSCGFFPESGIEILSCMSLIKTDKDGKLMMHDQMGGLGREIVRLENPKKPEERSRLWIHEEAVDVLDNNKGTPKIEALHLDNYSCKSFKSEQFKELTNLRFLQVNGVNFTGDFQNLFPQLRWLRWQACPSDFVATNFHLKKLVVLNLSWSGISEDWGGWGPLEMAIELRVLSLTHCHSLKRIPDLSAFEKLEILILEDCEKLEEIHSSIGDIKTLVSLNVKRCKGIEELPAGIGRMEDLRELLLDETAIRDIPILGGLMKLETLRASFCAQLAQLLESVGSLMSLTQLDLSHSGIEELPESIGFLKKLNTLDVSYCASLACIPSSIGHLTSLQRLLLRGCCLLREIPDSIVQLESLIELDLNSTAIMKLPESIENLHNLRILDIRGTDVTKLPTAIAMMEKLQELRCLHIDKSMEKMKDEAIQREEDIIIPDNFEFPIEEMIMDFPGRERNDESTEEMQAKSRQRAVEMVISKTDYAIAAVQNVMEIHDHAKQITDLLEMEVNDEVRIIGIYGTDGIGKTTLAKAVYKRICSCFDSCSFLAEVEETTQNSHGIQFLQNKLIHDILERDQEDRSFNERIEDFRDIFCEMKVLIVVDDVEKPSDLLALVGDHLRWFGRGSRIIVTSKNSGILKKYDSEKACNYMIGELDDGQALKIFCEYAFDKKSPMPGYDRLSDRVVKAIEKLPLAVEVVGSFLKGKSIQEWKKMAKSMEERMRTQKTTVGLEDILDICDKELDQQQKDIFLDIACFISGVDARIASYMWPNPSSVYIPMPLVKIGENNELQMHRLLRCLGKRIFKQEGSGDPSSRRFCTQDMVLKARNREKGMENVQALCFDFTAEDFQSITDIRFLKLDNAKVSGNFEGAFASLRWLCWQRCPLDFSAQNFLLTELVILDLSWSKITEEWKGWSGIKMKKLKVLNLTGCSDLLFTPDFSGYEYLEILILERCSHLVKLDPSIGNLKHLVYLNLKFCSQLNWLPAELGCTTALKELFIDGTSVRQIPISIGNLKQLEIFSSLNCFQLTHLPSSICYLTSLSKFSLEGAKISKLPSSLGKLQKLRRLSLRDCRCLKKLPNSIWEIGSLEELDISATSVSELPASIKNLESLKVLRMDSSFIRAFPKEIGNLTKLEELHASWCRSLKGPIPHDIKRLHCLRSLTLGHSSISSLPPAISNILSLHTLDLIQCDEIEELPKPPLSLICLRVSSKRMKAIPLLEDLKELEELCLSDGEWEARRPPSKLPMAKSNVKRMIDKPSFSISFPKLRKLELSLSQVVKLKFGPTDIPPLKRFRPLTLSGSSCKDVSELPKKLLAFKLYNSAIEEIEGLERLEALKRLDISNCKIQNLNGIGQITSLRSLILSDCDDISLLDLSNLKSLKVLEIIRCKKISQIEGLEKLTSLEKLNISECPAEKSVQVQDALKHVMARFPNT